MDILFKELIVFSQIVSLLLIYNHISGYKIPFYNYFIIPLFTRVLFFVSPVVCWLFMMFMFIGHAFLINRTDANTVKLFFGLFPSVMSTLIIRYYSYFIFPIFGVSLAMIENQYAISFLINCLVYPTYYLIMYSVKVDFSELNKIISQGYLMRSLLISNISMIIYYFVFQLSVVLNYENGIAFRQHMVIIYGMLFLILMIHLNGGLKEQLEFDLLNQKNRELQSLVSYSRQMEALYEEIRGFRHDYLNVLSSIKTGIDSNDMETVKMVYQSVLEKTGRQLENQKFHLTHLTQIENEAIKGVVSTKFLEAQNLGIDMTIEIEQIFHNPSIDLLDFVTILSILLDNALEAAVDSETSIIKLAFLEDTQQQVVVVENSIEEEQIMVGSLYAHPASTKGEGRGLGLVKIRRILELYPAVILQTQSKSYIFRQTLVFPRTESKGLK